MSTVQSKLTSQGQVSVPMAVRRALGLTPGSSIEWREVDGMVIVQRSAKRTTADARAALFGDQKTNGEIPSNTLAELKSGIANHIKARHARP